MSYYLKYTSIISKYTMYTLYFSLIENYFIKSNEFLFVVFLNKEILIFLWKWFEIDLTK